MNDFVAQLQAFISDLSPIARRSLGVGALVALLAIVGVGIWASLPNYVMLTRARTADEATQVARTLGQAGVPYRIADDGVTIEVPSSAQIDARQVAASEGIYVGLEALPTIPAFVTPGQEQLYAKRMIQGELVRMINALDGVASSDVQISLPERSAYLRNQQRATAAVTVQPDPGTSVNPGAAQSVAQLVAHAVTGMTPQDVTVVDASTMRTLWGGATDADGFGQREMWSAERTQALETSLATAVRNALGQVLGDPNASTVVVRVELETEEIQTTTKVVDPDQVVTATERLESEVDGEVKDPTGIPGTESNIPGAGGDVGTTGGRERESLSMTYEFGSSVSTVTKPAGEIRRISASVIVDSAAFDKVAAGLDAAATQKRLEQAVRGALGATEARGDVVVFDVLPFTAVEPEEEFVMATPVTGAVSSVLPGVSMLLAVLLTFLLVVRPLVGAALRSSTRRQAPTPSPVPSEAPPLAAVGGGGENNAISFADRVRDRVTALGSHTSTEVSDLVAKEAEPSAEVLRRWIRS